MRERQDMCVGRYNNKTVEKVREKREMGLSALFISLE